MTKFHIFYSWQSDLQGSKTRSFIRECIDEAIDLAEEADALEAKRDEATKDTTGSPDIVSSIYSKIDASDMFVADISLCFTGDNKDKKEKKSPNPNVLIELGYAARTLGWERILCLCNTEFGTNYPFDIAHNRIINYSYGVDITRENEKNRVSKLIFKNIRDLRKEPPRAKTGYATHIIGTFDFEKQQVISALKPIVLEKQDSFILHNQELLDESKKLLTEIQKYRLSMQDSEKNEQLEDVDNRDSINNKPTIVMELEKERERYINAAKMLSTIYNSVPATWETIDADKEMIYKWLHYTANDDFFNLGGLKKTKNWQGYEEIEGTDDEKAKYDKLGKLIYNLSLLEIRNNYLHTFDNMLYIPLAIQNMSAVYDNDIRIVINIDQGEIVDPDEQLICRECIDMEDFICRNDEDKEDIGLIGELFLIHVDNIITIEEPQYMIQTPKIPLAFFQNTKNSEDYKKELEEYIASSYGEKFYEFNIRDLKANECKWLPYGILIKPEHGRIELSYRIYSQRSLGDIEGHLTLE